MRFAKAQNQLAPSLMTKAHGKHHEILPCPFANWFAQKGWTPRPHQLALCRNVQAGHSTLLIAPTGAGKTLAGFLPSLIDMHNKNSEFQGVHTLYISPLKALTVDIARNLLTPIQEMGLPVSVETRTGDTPAHKRLRQKQKPPQLLLTTPEQLALLLSDQQAGNFFKSLKTVIFDELHALVTSKRGDLLSLGLARLNHCSEEITTIGLSATVADPNALQRWLCPQYPRQTKAKLVEVRATSIPDIRILQTKAQLPWAGHTARHAMAEIYKAVAAHKTTILFVNTRFQAELLFQELWHINHKNLPIALHHGSLDVSQRRKVEEAMAKGQLKAIVATSTLDLGLDWGDVDLVVHVGAPKSASRLAQRIGRSNHRMDKPSKGILVPANCFEVLECQAAVAANQIGAQDTPKRHTGALDVLAQHILSMACASPFMAAELYHEIISAAPYADLPRTMFDKTLAFVTTGGYALKSYDRFAKLRKTNDGAWRIAHPKFAQQYRMNVGTIIENPMISVRLINTSKKLARRGGRYLGQVEEYFIETLQPGDTFLFAGQVVCFEGIHDDDALVSRTQADTPKVPSFAGGKFPLSTYLAKRVRAMLSDPETWRELPNQVAKWLSAQHKRSCLPKDGQLLVETFPRGRRNYLVIYPFEGRLAHQTLGMLLTRRLERAGAQPLGFVANDYALSVWCLRDLSALIAVNDIRLSQLFDEDMLGDDLEAWMRESYMLKRTFRNCALIAGLIERRFQGQKKTGRQVTISSDLIYDVLRAHEPAHVLLQAAWADAATELLDIHRLGDMLSRIKNHIVHQPLQQASPLAVPVLLEIGKEPIFGSADEAILTEIAHSESHVVET